MSVAKLTKMAVLKMYDGRCAYCGAKLCRGTVTIDHVYPKSRGGTRHPNNIKPSCSFCNALKGSCHINVFKKKIIQASLCKTKFGKEIRKRYKIVDGNVIFYFEEIENEHENSDNRMNEMFKKIQAERERKKQDDIDREDEGV